MSRAPLDPRGREGVALVMVLMVIAILGFVWLIPPAWLRDPLEHGHGLIGWLLEHFL